MAPTRAFGRGLVFALVVLAAVVPASAQSPGGGEPVVGPELPVSRPVPGAPRDTIDQAVAYGGGVFVVAWIDSRAHVWASRVDRHGAVIDPIGVQLSTGSSTTPAVAFDGTNFLVVWSGAGSVQGRRLSPGGAVLDPAPIELSSSVGRGPEVSFGGGIYLVVWTGRVSDGAPTVVMATRLSPDGVVLEPADVPVVTPGGEQLQIDIAFNGTHHLLVFEQGDPSSRDVHGTLLTTDGQTLGPGQPISAAVGEQRRPVVTSTGSGFLVAWEDHQEGRSESDIHAARVRADGSVVDDPGIRIGTATDGFGYGAHDASWDGVDALVTWQTGDGAGSIRGGRIDRSGTLRDPAGVELVDGRHPASAFDGTHHLVTSVTSAERVQGHVEASRVTPDLVPLDPEGFAIAVGANQQTDVDMVFDGVNQFVVWIDDRSGQRAVYGARVGPDGQNLDGAGFPISVPPEPSTSIGAASVAFDGTNFLVVWWEGTSSGPIRAARVSRTGEVLDRFDVAPRGASADTPAVAFGNGVFLVAWVRGEDVMATRVGSDGTVLDPEGIPLAFHMSTLATFDIAAGASEFLVVWKNGRTFDPDNDNDVLGAVITPDGIVVGTNIPIAAAEFPIHEEDPAVVWHDGTYFVVWTHVVDDNDWPPEVSDIHGARVDPAGTVLDPSPLPISTAPGDQHLPDVAFNGRFLVTWTDGRRNSPGGDLEADVYAAPVNLDGNVGYESLVSTTDLYAVEAVVRAAPGDDNFAVVYNRYVPEPPYGTTRAFIRQVSPK
jgi:hypothetical protein